MQRQLAQSLAADNLHRHVLLRAITFSFRLRGEFDAYYICLKNEMDNAVPGTCQILLCIQWAGFRLIIDLDPPALPESAVRKWTLPSAFRDRRRQPKPKKVTTRQRRQVVGVGGPSMEYVSWKEIDR